MGLMDKAKAAKPAGDTFKKPDISSFVPPDQKDAVDRIIAAGMALMYSPQMREQLQQGVASQDPIPKKIADNTTGLMLTLDGKSKGGIPVGAIFPAAAGLAGECADVLVQAGQPVTQEDFNDALLMIYVQNGKKLGASDDELMQHAQSAVGGGEPDADESGGPPDGDADQAPAAPVPGAPQ